MSVNGPWTVGPKSQNTQGKDVWHLLFNDLPPISKRSYYSKDEADREAFKLNRDYGIRHIKKLFHTTSRGKTVPQPSSYYNQTRDERLYNKKSIRRL